MESKSNKPGGIGKRDPAAGVGAPSSRGRLPQSTSISSPPLHHSSTSASSTRASMATSLSMGRVVLASSRAAAAAARQARASRSASIPSVAKWWWSLASSCAAAVAKRAAKACWRAALWARCRAVFRRGPRSCRARAWGASLSRGAGTRAYPSRSSPTAASAGSGMGLVIAASGIWKAAAGSTMRTVPLGWTSTYKAPCRRAASRVALSLVVSSSTSVEVGAKKAPVSVAMKLLLLFVCVVCVVTGRCISSHTCT